MAKYFIISFVFLKNFNKLVPLNFVNFTKFKSTHRLYPCQTSYKRKFPEQYFVILKKELHRKIQIDLNFRRGITGDKSEFYLFLHKKNFFYNKKTFFMIGFIVCYLKNATKFKITKKVKQIEINVQNSEKC